MVTPILERDDKSRMLLKDYQDAASGKTKVSHKKQMQILQERLAYDQQLRDGQNRLNHDQQLRDGQNSLKR
jgi:hypothetical protein